MMVGYKLRSGELIHPARTELEGGGVGDGWAVAAPGTDSFTAWKDFSSQAAPQELEDLAERIRASSSR